MMVRGIMAMLVLVAGPAMAQPTDFGVRTLGGGAPASPRTELAISSAASGPARPFSLASAAAIAARHGIVTSTRRSAARNRAVGGARNSWHLHGRAIDIVRRSGVSHAALAAAFRAAGFRLIESLDEGDHSHFAFGVGPGPVPPRSAAEQWAEVSQEAKFFRFVSVPLASRR